jgi:nitroreductase
VVVDRLLERARRAPSAGHTQGWAWLVLEGEELTRRFWDVDADPSWLARPTHPGLLRAPVILVPLTNPSAYAQRYRDADKAAVGRPGGRAAVGRPGGRAALGRPGGRAAVGRPDGRVTATTGDGDPTSATDPDPAVTPDRPVAAADPADWPVPWWDVDTSFAIMLVLLGAVDEGLGALFFALHGDPDQLRESFGIPTEWRPLGAIALGWPDPDDQASASTRRGRLPWQELVHRGAW